MVTQIYKETQLSLFNNEQEVMKPSETLNAVQRNWKTPSEFPYCPQAITERPIIAYSLNLRVGEIFSRNKYGNSIIVNFAMSKDESTLWVVCQSSNSDAMKPWLLAQVTYENNLFFHSNLGSFFEQDSANKHFVLAQGLEWKGGEIFDDFT